MVTKEEMRQVVREEIIVALSISLPELAKRIEKAISLISVGSNSHYEGTSSPDGLELPELKVRAER